MIHFLSHFTVLSEHNILIVNLQNKKPTVTADYLNV